MFEQRRIGSAIHQILDARSGSSTFRATKVEIVLRPLVPSYAVLMRQKKLTARQAAVALITETVSKIDLGELGLLSADDPALVRQFALLYDGCKRMCASRPEEFRPYFHRPDTTVDAILGLQVRNA